MGVCGGIGRPRRGPARMSSSAAVERKGEPRLTPVSPTAPPKITRLGGRTGRPSASACKAWLVCLLPVILATTLLLPASAGARGSPSRTPTTNPVALSLKLAEQYWHGMPACGTPTIVTSAHQLPNSDYESVTSPEPANSVVEMWTEVQRCTITINTSLWASWHQDDESFQWFCDAMTHEVGHLFGHPDSGQTNPSSITYPFLRCSEPQLQLCPRVRIGHPAIRSGENSQRRNIPR